MDYFQDGNREWHKVFTFRTHSTQFLALCEDLGAYFLIVCLVPQTHFTPKNLPSSCSAVSLPQLLAFTPYMKEAAVYINFQERGGQQKTAEWGSRPGGFKRTTCMFEHHDLIHLTTNSGGVGPQNYGMSLPNSIYFSI